MSKMIIEFRDIFKLLRVNLKRFIKYQLASKFIMTIILLPLFYQLAGMLLNSSQYDFLANGLIRKFYFFSPRLWTRYYWEPLRIMGHIS